MLTTNQQIKIPLYQQMRKSCKTYKRIAHLWQAKLQDIKRNNLKQIHA